MKKMLLFLIVCALCVSLIACSQPAQTETTEATTLPTENTAPFDWGSVLDSTGSGCAMENVGNE